MLPKEKFLYSIEPKVLEVILVMCKPACKGMKLVFLGALLIANEMFFQYPWAYLLGAVAIIFGLYKMLLPICPCGGMACCKDDSCCKEEEHKTKKAKK
jgi:hypothetical protein